MNRADEDWFYKKGQLDALSLLLDQVEELSNFIQGVMEDVDS